MAIDDNTLYGLTGAQVKELPGKIDAVKGLARELTTEDYNWPTNNPNGVAMWLLPEGMYSCDATTEVYPDNASSSVNRPLFFKFNSGNYSTMVFYHETDKNWRYWETVTSTGARYSYGRVTPEIINSLTSTSTTSALSANQGKVLNDKIGDLTNLDTTTQTDLVSAINEVLAGAGGGGITELTSADYNWPTSNPTSIALWLLPTGNYLIKSGTATQYANGWSVNTSSDTSATVQSNAGSGALVAVYNRTTSPACWHSANVDINGSFYEGNNYTGTLSLTTYDALDALNNATGRRTPLSAYQGRVLKGLIDGLQSTVDDIEPQSGSGAPTTSTEGTVGQTYVDTATGDIYYLSEIDSSTTPATYSWAQIATGTGVNVVQTTGTSTADVMSQNATTSMVFADPSTKRMIQIGVGASASGNNVVAVGPYSSASTNSVGIGYNTESTGTSAVAIGAGTYGAKASGASSIALGAETWATGQSSIAIGTGIRNNTAKGSIAIGFGSVASSVGEMNIGSSNVEFGYNNSNYRLLTGLYDPQNAHDAATKGYVDTSITTAISGITGVQFEVVQTLPATGDAGTIYLVPNSGTTPNIYDEYIYVNNSFEKIGTTEIDLSNYVTNTQLNTTLAAYATTSSLATVATTGDYEDLINTPAVFTSVEWDALWA